MKYFLQLIILIFVFAFFLACQQQTAPLTNEEKREIDENIQQTLKDYYDDIRKSGLTAEFKYLDNSADFFWVPPGYSSAISYDSVASVINQNATLYKSVDNSIETLKVVPLTKELATYTARINSTMTDPADKTTKFSLVETGVLIKRQDGWKLLNGQTAVVEK
jgi:hypothetical protein